MRTLRLAHGVHSHHEPVLGTVLHLYLKGHGRRALADAEGAALHEIQRLEQIFSVYLADSELNRWRRTPALGPVGPELAALLRASLHWQRASSGAFNPSGRCAVGRCHVKLKPPRRAAVTRRDRTKHTVTVSSPRWTFAGIYL